MLDRLFDWLGRRSWRIFILPAVVIGGGFALLLWMNQRDRAVADATFLAQCREAGYDTAKCRLFLIDPGE
jgi:hypothetical protein